jgi:hypothetical protein
MLPIEIKIPFCVGLLVFVQQTIQPIQRLRRLLRYHAFKLATCVTKLLIRSFKCSHCWRKALTSPCKLAFSRLVVSNCRNKLSHAVCKPLNCCSCSRCKVSSAFNKCRSSSVIV